MREAPMQIPIIAILLLASAASPINLRAAAAAGSLEKITMKDEIGRANPKWKFVAGQWVRRTSGGRSVRAQTVETQPWAVAILEDQKLEDLDVTVHFRPISGREDASGGI